MLKIQDENGKQYNQVNKPAAVYDARHSVLYKIGEWEDMVVYFETLQAAYRRLGLPDIADDICIMELPKDQEEIDKVFQICDYIGTLHKQALN